MGLFLRRKTTTYLNTVNAITQERVNKDTLYTHARTRTKTRTRTHARQVSILLDSKKVIDKYIYNSIYLCI